MRGVRKKKEKKLISITFFPYLFYCLEVLDGFSIFVYTTRLFDLSFIYEWRLIDIDLNALFIIIFWGINYSMVIYLG